MTHEISHAAIRRASPRDAASIARVQVDSWQAAYLGLIPASVLNRLSVEAKTASWRRVLTGETPGSHVWVAVDGARMLGFVCLGPTRDGDDDPRKVGEIYAIYLAPIAWGRGLGGALLDAAQNDLARKRFNVATLWVLEGNTRARHFYELAGFEPDGARRTEDLGPTTLPEMRYRRLL